VECQVEIMQLTIEVPDEIQQAMRVPEPERRSRLRIELASALYEREILSLGKAAELSGLSQFHFGQALKNRGIARHYTDADIAEDLGYARG
jgi:predicted HTH domain antitoxin